MRYYSFYNAPLIDTMILDNKLSPGFVVNSIILAIGNSLIHCHAKLKGMMEGPGGGFDWSSMHNSPFELSKMALMSFPRSHRDLVPGDLTLDKPNPGGSVTTSVMVPTLLHKYLGVIVDPKLHWSLQHTKSFTMVLKNLAPTSSTTHHCVLHCFSLFCGRHTSVLMSCDLGLNSWLVNWASWNCCIFHVFHFLGFLLLVHFSCFLFL